MNFFREKLTLSPEEMSGIAAKAEAAFNEMYGNK